MNADIHVIVIHCAGCRAYPCAVSCPAGALAFFHGNIMIDAAKCAPCPRFKKGLIPLCVAECAKGGEKRIIEECNVEKKRVLALSALDGRS